MANSAAFYVVSFRLGILRRPVLGGLALERGGMIGTASVAFACAALGVVATILSRRQPR